MYGATSWSDNMPSATTRRLYQDQVPTFMSVFDFDAVTIADCEMATLMEPKLAVMDSKSVLAAHPSANGLIQHNMNRKHSDSRSTQNSESTDSSPTTTLSTTGLSPLTDRSPSPSPDSPVIVTKLVPLNNYPSTTFRTLSATNSTGMLPIPETDGPLNRPMTSPSPRRLRNMKGLSILPPLAVMTTTKTTTTTMATPFEPSSPGFIKPQIPAMRRRPSHLSLQTNTKDLLMPPSNHLPVPPSPAMPPFNLQVPPSPAMPPSNLQVPPSPAAMPPILQRRALKHSTSTPHMPSMTTTRSPVPPLPTSNMLERNESGLSEVLRPTTTRAMRASIASTTSQDRSPIKTQMANRQDFESHHESINNEDQKSPTYPDGPIAIYGDDVYLYLEPTAQEAAKFDVVFNVAHEVENPFKAFDKKQAEEAAKKPFDWSPMFDTTTAVIVTNFELGCDDSDETPTTPKASSPLKRRPEYIHIPWDHNTDIAPDLMHLCESIHAYTKQGKKVLIHCQQGASRSASLIIAYGLYLNPELSVNDAYYAAQAKSRWISPNMKLMYCLQDFQKEVSQKMSASKTCAFRPRPGRSPCAKHRLTLSADSIDLHANEPLSAPLPAIDQDRERQEKLKDGSKRARGNSSSPRLQMISPGPASAPMNIGWPSVESCRPDSKEEESEELAVPPMPTIPPPPVPTTQKSEPARQQTTLHVERDSGVQTESKSTESWLRSLQPPIKHSRSRVGMRTLPLRSFQDHAPSGLTSHFITVPSPSGPLTPYEDGSPPSPRAETMTSPSREFAGFVGLATTTTTATASKEVFSPRKARFPVETTFFFGQHCSIADPRSPPRRGEAPITRSIDDLL